MPETEEIKCTSSNCELDMVEVHYTYDVDDDLTVSDLNCPLCDSSGSLELIEV